MRPNVVKEKSEAFAIAIIALLKKQRPARIGTVLSNQLIRSGTSVGAMINEAEFAESRRDFKHKFQVAQKEINETLYWLRLMHQSGFIETTEYENLSSLGNEILYLITAIIRKTIMNMKIEDSSKS